jgi:hypothetical protein
VPQGASTAGCDSDSCDGLLQTGDADVRVLLAYGGEEAMTEHPATFTMHTPNGPTDCCVDHARKLEALMRMLGVHTKAVKAPEGATCKNCENEAMKNLP